MFTSIASVLSSNRNYTVDKTDIPIPQSWELKLMMVFELFLKVFSFIGAYPFCVFIFCNHKIPQIRLLVKSTLYITFKKLNL
jgi:hypothetical protein